MADDHQLAEATQALSFAEFLERMKDPQAANLVKLIKTFIKTFDDKPPNPDKDAERVQAFLTKSEGTFRDHPVWASAPADHQSQAMEGLEKYLMTKIYYKVFAQSDLDRERDDALSQRMAALSFVRPEHLDIPRQYHEEGSWLRAINELHKLNSYKAPRDKLVCVLNCCRVINNLLHVADNDGNEARGADDFLPVLIYVVIHANPQQLASNLEYIQRFRMHSRMVSESAYFFTQLYSAASFVETINSSSLTMDSDEFVARMIAAGIPDMEMASTQPASPKAKPAQPPALPQAGAPAPPAAAHPNLGLDTPSQASLASSPERPAGTTATSDTTVNPMLTADVLPIYPTSTSQPPATASDAHTSADLQVDSPSASQTPPTPSQHTTLTPTPSNHPAADLQTATSAQTAASQQHPWPSVAELEAEGVEQMLQAEATGHLQQHYSFLYASAPDLRVDDVPVLLRQYKELILKHEALVCAVESHRAQQQGQPPRAGQGRSLLANAPSGGKSGGTGGSAWQHYDRQSSGQSQHSSREALPLSAFSEAAAQDTQGSTAAASEPSAQLAGQGVFGAGTDFESQLQPASNPQQSSASPLGSHGQSATPANASIPTPPSPFEQNEAQVRNTLTAASQPLPPDATAELDAKVVDDRFVTMSSADALEEAVRSENDVSAATAAAGMRRIGGESDVSATQ